MREKKGMKGERVWNVVHLISQVQYIHYFNCCNIIEGNKYSVTLPSRCQIPYFGTYTCSKEVVSWTIPSLHILCYLPFYVLVYRVINHNRALAPVNLNGWCHWALVLLGGTCKVRSSGWTKNCLVNLFEITTNIPSAMFS